LALLSGLFVLSLPLTGSLAFAVAASRIFVGFFAFLRQNLPRISSDAGTWGPGLASFLVALVVIHRFGLSWARHRQQVWRISGTLAFGMMLPLLFAISFLVPGVFLQVQQLANTPWFVREFGEASYFKQQLQMLDLHLIDAAEEYEHYPDSLEPLVERKLIKSDDPFLRGRHAGQPREPVLYLGKGLTTSSDPSLPLLISPPYSEDGKAKRMILTTGHEVVVIAEDELDAWLERTTASHDGVKQ
jgi:hypothetical protein